MGALRVLLLLLFGVVAASAQPNDMPLRLDRPKRLRNRGKLVLRADTVAPAGVPKSLTIDRASNVSAAALIPGLGAPVPVESAAATVSTGGTPEAVPAPGTAPLDPVAGDASTAGAGHAANGNGNAALKSPRDVRPGEYVIVYKSDVADPGNAARSQVPSIALKQAAANPSAAAAAAGDPALPAAAAAALAPPPFTVFGSSPPQMARAAASGGLDAPSGDAAGYSPVRIAGIRLHPAADEALVLDSFRANPQVAGVYPNSIYRTMQTGGSACATPLQITGYSAVHSIGWPGCLGNTTNLNTSLVWYGKRCGAKFDQIQWTGVYAADNNDGAMRPNCHLSLTSLSARQSPSRDDVFGSCGVAPRRARLPVVICEPAQSCAPAGSLGDVLVERKVAGCSRAASFVAYTGSVCNGGFVRWTAAYMADGAAAPRFCRARPMGAANFVYDAQWFGDCGVPPSSAPSLPYRVCGAPPPPPPAAALAREALRAGEAPLPGMDRIQAAVDGQVPVYPEASTVTVAVIDTGGTMLSDLNVQSGLSFVGGAASPTGWEDLHGHGTHISGTISGRNNGEGVYGAMPGVKVLPLRVMDENGEGSTFDIMQAIDYVARSAYSKNIGVINLSLGGSGTASDIICASIAAVQKAGVIVAAAAGNYGASLQRTTPAACASAVAVTAINPRDDRPAWFSNFLYGSASAAEKRRSIAAPGVDIVSMLPNGTYVAFSGTSMATPHVAGAAARCFVAGDCKIPATPGAAGKDNTAKFLDAVWAKFNSKTDAAYRWSADNAVRAFGETYYYGPYVWAARW